MGIVKNNNTSLIDRLLSFKMATSEPTNEYYSFIGGKKDAEPEPEKEKKVEQTTTFEERFKHRFRILLPPYKTIVVVCSFRCGHSKPQKSIN